MCKSYQSYGQTLKERLEKILEPDELDIEGATMEQIEEVIRELPQKRWPEVYIQYLLVFGIHINTRYIFDQMESLFYLVDAQEEMWNEIENEAYAVPKDALCFASDDGVFFYYFLTDNEDDNPPIYEIADPDPVYPSLTAYFEAEFNNLEDE